MRTLDAAELHRWCLAQTGAVEVFTFGPEHSVFKVGGKMFALSALDRTPLEVSVKCEPELAVQLRNSYGVIRPGYHLHERHCNTVRLDGSLPDRLVPRPHRGLLRPRRQRTPEAHARAAGMGARSRPGPRRLSAPILALVRPHFARSASAYRG